MVLFLNVLNLRFMSPTYSERKGCKVSGSLRECSLLGDSNFLELRYRLEVCQKTLTNKLLSCHVSHRRLSTAVLKFFVPDITEN